MRRLESSDIAGNSGREHRPDTAIGMATDVTVVLLGILW